jgi:hypothetical protein
MAAPRSRECRIFDRIGCDPGQRPIEPRCMDRPNRTNLHDLAPHIGSNGSRYLGCRRNPAFGLLWSRAIELSFTQARSTAHCCET